MARNLTAGDVVNGYTIDFEINRGNLAFAYGARSPEGKQVFLKQFKSPSPLVTWYPDYIAYQDAMRTRIDSTPLKNFICRILDLFEAPVPPRNTQMCYYQAFEYVERGQDLGHFLAALAENPYALKWERRLVWAKVIMGSIRQMHEHGIVHGDLKPPNLMLIADKAIKVGYRLKMIDIDFSIIVGRKAPWHGDMGYVGTPGYFSPEHLAGRVPEPASDIFTCGLILSELLARTHPYSGRSDEDYRASIGRHAAPRIVLDGPMPRKNDAEVAETIHQMLHPNPAARPNAERVLNVLNGVSTPVTADPAKVEPATPEVVRPDVAKPEARASRLRLGFGAFTLPVAITTRVNQHLVKGAGPDSQFWDGDHQFTLERRGDAWFVVPNEGARNDTIHNGHAVKAATVLHEGDEIGVGRETKGIIKTPAKISFE